MAINLPNADELLKAFQEQGGPGSVAQAGANAIPQAAQLADTLENKKFMREQRKNEFALKAQAAIDKDNEDKRLHTPNRPVADILQGYGVDPKSTEGIGLAKAHDADANGHITLAEQEKLEQKLATMKSAGIRVDGLDRIAGARMRQLTMNKLPSNMSPNTVPGAAAQVQLAARQGKALISKPGSPQDLALASSDLVRVVQRSAPQLETLRGASFANNLVTKASLLAQKITANPVGMDTPKLRKEMYDLFDELENSSKPYIQQQMKQLKEAIQTDPFYDQESFAKMYDNELGGGIETIPFQENATPTTTAQPTATSDDFFKHFPELAPKGK